MLERKKSTHQQLFEKEFIHNDEYRHKVEDDKHTYKRKPKNNKEWKQWTSNDLSDLEQD